jgi:asparagine synthase (glutamine-hydrolysing)
MRGFLPDEVITKKKQGFGLPFGVWMVEHAALNALTRDALRALVPRGLIRDDFVRRFFDELLPSHPHYYGTMAWILLMLEHWLRARAPDWSAAQ